jgi:hypothetical protein
MNSLRSEGGFGSINDGVKTFRVCYGDFAQHLPVQDNVGLFAAVDKLAVSYSSLPAGCA